MALMRLDRPKQPPATLTVGNTLPDFTLIGVKPGFMRPEGNGESAFETLTPENFPLKW